jgi:hypothetical protein
MNKAEALADLVRLIARVKELPDDAEILGVDLRKYVGFVKYPHIHLRTKLPSFDLRERVDCKAVHYIQFYNGVAVSWYEDEPLPAGV